MHLTPTRRASPAGAQQGSAKSCSLAKDRRRAGARPWKTPSSPPPGQAEAGKRRRASSPRAKSPPKAGLPLRWHSGGTSRRTPFPPEPPQPPHGAGGGKKFREVKNPAALAHLRVHLHPQQPAGFSLNSTQRPKPRRVARFLHPATRNGDFGFPRGKQSPRVFPRGFL